MEDLEFRPFSLIESDHFVATHGSNYCSLLVSSLSRPRKGNSIKISPFSHCLRTLKLPRQNKSHIIRSFGGQCCAASVLARLGQNPPTSLRSKRSCAFLGKGKPRIGERTSFGRAKNGESDPGFSFFAKNAQERLLRRLSTDRMNPPDGGPRHWRSAMQGGHCCWNNVLALS